MKRILLSATVLLTSSVYAQTELAPQAKLVPELTSSIQKITQPTTYKNTKSTTAVVLFEETFGNGLAGDNTSMAWTTYGSVTGADWEYRGTSTSPDNTVGSRGYYAGTTGIIGSTTLANGFFIFDSDYLDNGGNAAIGGGSVPAPHSGYLISPVIDLSTQIAPPSLEFASYMRRFQGEGYIEFSQDGGVTWSERVDLYNDDNLAVNERTDSLNVERVSIPASVANATQFRMRFVFDGEVNGDGYYFWQIDDIKITEAANNDLELVDAFVSPLPDDRFTYYFAQVPEFIAEWDTLTWSAYYKNTGKFDQPNTKLNVTVSGQDAATIASGTVNASTGGMVDSLSTVPAYYIPNQGVGVYNFDVAVISDSVDSHPDNNSTTFTYEVTENEYSIADPMETYSSTFWVTEEYSLRVEYPVYADAEVTAIGIDIGEWGTKPGALISAKVENFDGSFNTVTGNEYVTLTQEQIDAGIVYFPVPKTAISAGFYYATFQSFVMGDTVSVQVNQDHSAPRSRVFIEYGGTNYYTDALPLLTMKFANEDLCNPSASITFDIKDNQEIGAIDVVEVTGMADGEKLFYWEGPAGYTSTSENIENLYEQGEYVLTVQDNNGCEVTATALLEGIVSTDDLLIGNDDFSVYPNPSTGVINVKSTSLMAGEYTLKVNNIMGQTVNQQTLMINDSQSNYTVNLDSLTKGVYILTLDNGTSQVSKRIILE